MHLHVGVAGWLTTTSVAALTAVVLDVAGAQGQTDPLRQQRLATDRELSTSFRGVEAFDDSPPGIPIRSLVSDDYNDLEFLRELLAGAQVVQLGESGHGMGESFALKARLARFLHRELGFNVMAFESDLYQCFEADRAAREWSARRTLVNCPFGVWHTEGVLGLFELIRNSRETERPLRLAGFDIQPIGPNKEHRPRFLAGLAGIVDARYADSVAALDSTFLAVYAEGGRARRQYFRSHRDALVAAYDSLTAFLHRHHGSLEAEVGLEAALAGRRTAWSIAQYIRQQTAPDLESYTAVRDSSMAENVRFLRTELFPGEKMILWAHNAHVRTANQDIPVRGGYSPRVRGPSMGTWLRQMLGEAVYTVGMYAFEGEAVNNSRMPYPIAPAPPGTLEHRLAEAGRRLAFFDLRGLRRRGVGWVSEPQIARYNGTVHQILVPADQYDAVVFVGAVTPPVLLY